MKAIFILFGFLILTTVAVWVAIMAIKFLSCFL